MAKTTGTGLESVLRRKKQPAFQEKKSERDFINEAGKGKEDSKQRAFTLNQTAQENLDRISKKMELFNHSQTVRNIVNDFILNKKELIGMYKIYIQDIQSIQVMGKKSVKKLFLSGDIMEKISSLRNDFNVNYMSRVLENLINFYAHIKAI